MEQCDRVYVMHEGRIIKELEGDQVTVNNIITVSFKEKSKGASHAQAEIIKSNQQKETTGKVVTNGAFSAIAAGGNQQRGIISKTVTNRAFLAIVTLIAIYTVNSILNPRVITYMGTELLFSSAIPLIFVALSQMFIVISGGIDFGNGQALGLVNVIVAFKIVQNPGLGIAFIILFVLGYAALGAIIHITKIPAIIITLGASFIWLGLALILAPSPGGKAPLWLSNVFNFQFPLIPMPIVIAILAGLLGYWIVRKSKYGMIINAFGNNPSAITRAGWSQLQAMIVTYAIAGLFLVVAGFMLTAISNSGDANATRSYCMLSFATIILGGCEFAGGIGSPVGVVVAALAISSISALLTFIGIDSNLQSAVTGLILIIALTIKLIGNRVEAKRWI
jgi:ribose transport system ATP-binding protein